jgi:hypothetical protein
VASIWDFLDSVFARPWSLRRRLLVWSWLNSLALFLLLPPHPFRDFCNGLEFWLGSSLFIPLLFSESSAGWLTVSRISFWTSVFFGSSVVWDHVGLDCAVIAGICLLEPQARSKIWEEEQGGRKSNRASEEGKWERRK